MKISQTKAKTTANANANHFDMLPEDLQNRVHELANQQSYVQDELRAMIVRSGPGIRDWPIGLPQEEKRDWPILYETGQDPDNVLQMLERLRSLAEIDGSVKKLITSWVESTRFAHGMDYCADTIVTILALIDCDMHDQGNK